MEALQWTPYLDECCRALEKAGECQSDIYLVYLVRQQRIIEKIKRAFSHDRQEGLDSGRSSAPVGMYIQSLGAELQSLRNSVPLKLQQNSQSSPLPKRLLLWRAYLFCLHSFLAPSLP